VLNPSEVTLDEEVTGVVVLNNSTYPEADSLYPDLPERLTENELFIIDTIVIRNTFNGLFSVLDDSPISALREAEYLEIRNTEQTGLPQPLSRAAVIDLLDETGSDLLVSLENYDFVLKYYNDYVYLPEVHSYLEFNRKNLWRIYGKEGELLDTYLLNDTVFWSSAGYSKLDAESGLPGVTDAIRSAYYYAGEEYGKRISPSWQEASRVHYKFSKRGIFPGAGIDNSFDETYLLELSNSKKRNKAYKACINLALLSEKNDRLKEALYWLDLAEVKKPSTRLVKLYKNIIRERLIKREKINKQIMFNH